MLAPLSQTASAADLPGGGGGYKDTPYVVVPWQGLYFGGHAGGAWGNTNVHDKFDYSGDPEFNGSASSLGLIGGLQAGYNVQRGHAVFGLEGDVGYLGISTSQGKTFDHRECESSYAKNPNKNNSNEYQAYTFANGTADMCNINAQYSSSSALYADLTARLGYATDRTLFYLKGGLAVLDADSNSSYQGQNCVTTGRCSGATHVGTSNFNFDHSETLVGWTVGGGVEYALSPSWSLKAEYQHFDFGKMSSSYNGCVAMGVKDSQNHPFVCPPSSQGYANHYTSQLSDGKTDVSVTADAVKVGINYHVGKE